MNVIFLTANDLYKIVREYSLNVEKIDLAYGNGFDRKGKAYFAYLCDTFPNLKKWVEENYPEASYYF